MDELLSSVTHIAVAVVENDNGQFLVGHRPDGAALAGLAEFPGGKVEPGELPAHAAVRECAEETGIAVEVVSCLAEVPHEYDHGMLHLHFFHCRPISKHNLAHKSEPLGSFRWVNRNELARLEFPAANRSILSELLKS